MQMSLVRFGLPRLHSQDRPNGLRGSVRKAEVFLPVHRGKQGNVKLCELCELWWPLLSPIKHLSPMQTPWPAFAVTAAGIVCVRD